MNLGTGMAVPAATKRLIVFLAILAILAIVVGYALGDGGATAPIEITLEPVSHLPVIRYDPTLEPPTHPRLRDGHYHVDLSGEADGYITFDVRNDGTTATNADFLYDRKSPSYCGALRQVLSGSRPISDGYFVFYETNNATFTARMDCQSLTRKSAECTVHKWPWLTPSCAAVTAVVSRQ